MLDRADPAMRKPAKSAEDSKSEKRPAKPAVAGPAVAGSPPAQTAAAEAAAKPSVMTNGSAAPALPAGAANAAPKFVPAPAAPLTVSTVPSSALDHRTDLASKGTAAGNQPARATVSQPLKETQQIDALTAALAESETRRTAAEQALVDNQFLVREYRSMLRVRSIDIDELESERQRLAALADHHARQEIVYSAGFEAEQATRIGAEAEAAARAAEAKAALDRLAELIQERDLQSARISAAEAETEMRHADLARLGEEMRGTRAELDARSAEVAKLRSEIRDIDRYREQVDALWGELESRRDLIALQDSELAARQDEIARLRAELQRLNQSAAGRLLRWFGA